MRLKDMTKFNTEEADKTIDNLGNWFKMWPRRQVGYISMEVMLKVRRNHIEEDVMNTILQSRDS